MCIDICPVGALTSGAYRYKTRPWEMNHVGTTCTHCADGCKTTLGVRRSDTGMEIVRGDNRDKSGINGDFLCIKGRYAFDFAKHEDRLTQPLMQEGGRLTPSTWEEAFELIGKKFAEVRDRDGGQAIGVIGSTRTTNEENYLLQKFARVVLGTNNIDHHRTADLPGLAAAIQNELPHVSQNRGDMGHPPVLLLPCVRCRCICDSADWERSDRSASVAGVADSQQRAPAQRAALRGERSRNQAAAAGD